MIRKLSLLIYFSLLPCIWIKAQEKLYKYELERRIKRSEFPVSALEQLDQLKGEKRRARYYKEWSNSVVTYEAKFKWMGKQWSLEFDSTGIFKDIEQLIPNRVIKKIITERMREDIKRLGSPYKIVRVQRQFSWLLQNGQPFDPQMVNPGHKGVKIQYEIELEAKTAEGKLVSYEVLLDEDGKLLRKREIISYSDKHLLY